MVEGNPDFTVDFLEQQQLYDLDNFALTLTLVATLYNQDVTDDITAENIEWTRYSLDASGNERTAADNAWALGHAGIGKQLKATIEDLGIDSTGFPSKVVFTCTATLKDGLTNSVNLEMI
jgi:hypothetical protein